MTGVSLDDLRAWPQPTFDIPTEFTTRQLTTDLPRGRFGTKDDVEAAVDVLDELGWVSLVPAPPRTGPGRPPSPRYRCHPHVNDDTIPFTTTEVSAESALSAEPPPAQGSADTADNAETSVEPSCLACEVARRAGAAGCSECYAAGRIDDDGRSTA